MKRVLALIALVALTASVNAGEKAPTFNDVAPIVFENCASCHRPGQAAPFSLLTFADAKKRGKLIADVTHSRLMPPWKADKGDVEFRNERHLTDAQIATIRKWVDAGMPEGDASKAPPAPKFAAEWPLGKPDLVVKMPKSFNVPAKGRDIYRDFAVALNLKEDVWIRAIDFRPSAPSVVHHTLFFVDTTGTSAKREADSGQVGVPGGMGGAARFGGKDGKKGGAALGGLGGILGGLSGEGGTDGVSRSLGGWAVGAQARALPDGLAYRVTKGSDLILSTHFHPSGKAEEEASTVAFYFADKAPTKRFTGLQIPMAFGILAGIDIPAGKKDFTISDTYTLPVDTRAFGIGAHAHYIAKTFDVTATPPGAKTKTLLKISDWDFGWQEQYEFKDYVDLPKGTKLSARITYDNSAENPHNPTNPPRRVKWGKESTDEMGSITLLVVAAREEEFKELKDSYSKHLGDAALKMLRKKIGKE
jgi:mono/diheme cytochrome c family protein